MTTIKATMTVAALAVVLVAGAPSSASAACFNKASEGTGGTVEGAKFQAFEAILQSFSWGTWASWMTSGQTPGYKITTKYKCNSGSGLGVTCRANSRICPQ